MKCLPLCLVLIVSCASTKNGDKELLVTNQSKWFGANSSHALLDSESKPKTHLFFDFSPDFSEKEQLVNVVITTPQNSERAYSIDVVSGQRYYSGTYCKQNDVWGSGASIERPNFAVGFLPRTLDQRGEPHKVIVFGAETKVQESMDKSPVRARLIGGYIEESCPEINCLGKDNWVSRLVLIAVDQRTQSLEEVEKWNRLQVVLQNIDGRKILGDKEYPSTRVRNLLDYKNAVSIFRGRSSFMNSKSAEKIQRSCHLLYDKFWSDVGKDRPEDMAAKNQDELKKKVKLINELKTKKLPVSKLERFRKFAKAYFGELATCEKFIYHGNINKDLERFWFHSYMGIFARLHKEGHHFDCRRKLWGPNQFNVNGEPIYSLSDEIDFCSEKDIDQAMDYLPQYIKTISASEDASYYKFIDYDNYTFGSHQKIYNWVKSPKKNMSCSPNPNKSIMEKIKLGPEDAPWKRWKIIDVADEMKVIY